MSTLHRLLPHSALGTGLLLMVPVLVTSCGDDAPAAPTAEVVQARDQAAEYGLWEKDGWADAQRTMAPIVAEKNAAAEDLLRMACATLGTGAIEEAQPYLDRAEKLAPDHPVLLWCRFRIARIQYENSEALAILRRLRELVPDDIPTKLALGMVLSDLAMDDPDEGEAFAVEAIEELEAFLAIPSETTGSWRVTALFRLSSLLSRRGEEDRAATYFAEYKRFGEQGIESPGEPEHQPGSLGEIPPHTPEAFTPAPPAAPAPLALAAVPGSEGARGFVTLRMEADPEPNPMAGGPSGEELWNWSREAPQVVSFGPSGVKVHPRAADGSWADPQTILETATIDAVPFDRGNMSTEPTSFRWRRPAGLQPGADTVIDLLVAVESGSGFELRLLEHGENGWELNEPFFRSDNALEPGHIVPVDLDHEGDLDLIVATASSVHVLRNDDFDASPTGMTEVSADLPLPSGSFRPVAEDVDRDNDVDMAFVDETSGAVRFLSSERGWKFVDATANVPATSGRYVALADLDGTGFVDFAELSDKLRVHVRGAVGGDAGVLEWAVDEAPGGPPVAVDWDLDGSTDLIWPTETGGVAGILSPGFANGGVAFTLAGGSGSAGVSAQAVDLDGDYDQDLLVLNGEGVQVGIGDGPKGLALELRGYKDNARGVGVEVHIREGLRYRRVFWKGQSGLIGVGEDTDGVDMLRITWPNGVVQSYFLVQVGMHYVIWQRPGLVGSCPFLYTWNGTTYEFISDVLGITPLGLPIGPGQLVPPDHDEFVLVTGEQMVPKDGFYELQFTEELREVTYLDRIRLDVIDHPADVEIFPNERFTFPPFPEHHVHTVRGPLVPEAVTDGEGRDWKAALSSNDMELAIPFEPLPGQFQGLATPHYLELTFDEDVVRDASKLRLLLNGWFFWTDASVNMASARHPDVEFVPPLLQVPDGNGEWQTVGPPLGFPAGKLKTMVVDVTPFVNRADPRMRIFSTLRLYWDSIRLAVDEDDAKYVSTSLEPKTAELWERGFSEPIALEGKHRLDWFEWDKLAAEPRWNQHPGRYTRFGDCIPLVTAIDDRFIVMGAGDALTVRFDAGELPPLQDGWRRDFLVFLDGWAKDRDHNTVEALHVDPLPFHGMSSYPYPENEHFPDDEEHRAWLHEWQTRPAKQWIAPPVPIRRTSAPIAGL